jgi:prepilin-type N-terminal cleavage/methylation domain-containing protein
VGTSPRVREFERGFTLVETVVTLGIVAVLLAAGGAWLLAMHPGALTHATDDYDAALASARGFAATSGNGATLVFAPRAAGVPGFTLRVFSGRPSGAGAVQPSDAMPVESDATVSETTLGKPPFAIFIGASGHASGKAAYPAFDAAGNPAFAVLPAEPACPAGGFALTFTGPQGAVATRTLPCTPTASGAPGGPGMPNPSPTPNVPIVTPASLVYHWPADAEQTFVATEWGYTHWFASATGFECGAGVAAYPDVLPKPYSPPYTKAEGLASPAPPAAEPFAYPNSGGASMNDAPATFRLDPGGEGLCTREVRDEYDQVARGTVQVMGWLAVAYGGKAYTHLSASSLALPASALPKRGAAVTLAVSKTYDAEALLPAVALDAACSPYVSVDTAGGTTPAKPSAKAATASVTLTLATLPKSKIECGGTIYDQYDGSQAGEGVPFNATIQPEDPLSAWPPAEQVGAGGASVGMVAYDTSDPVRWLNRLAGGADAIAATPCLARAYTGTGFGNPIAGASFKDAAGNVIVQTDSGGCILDGAGTPLPGAAIATEPGYTGAFGYRAGDCDSYLSFAQTWEPKAVAPGSDRLDFGGSLVTPTYCTFDIIGDASLNAGSGLATPAPIEVTVIPCAAMLGTLVTVPINNKCELAVPGTSGTEPCVSGDEQPPYPTLVTHFASFDDTTGHDTGMVPVPSSAQGNLVVARGRTYFVRGAPGRVTVYVITETETAHKSGIPPPNGSCVPDIETTTLGEVHFD